MSDELCTLLVAVFFVGLLGAVVILVGAALSLALAGLT